LTAAILDVWHGRATQQSSSSDFYGAAPRSVNQSQQSHLSQQCRLVSPMDIKSAKKSNMSNISFLRLLSAFRSEKESCLRNQIPFAFNKVPLLCNHPN
jgi:hypothetical protein